MSEVSGKIRVVLGDDSGFIRILMGDYLRQDPQIDLVATATHGGEVVDLTAKLQPDVVITDLVMPEYDGVYAVKSIMQQNPTPIILLSSLSRSDSKVFEALEAGAAEFMGKPQGQPSPKGTYALRLNQLVKTLAQRKTMPKPKSITTPELPLPKLPTTHQHEVIVVGSSTGGPAVLEGLLRQLPAELPVPLVIAQHMPATFLEMFARRLDGLTALKVQLATDGMVLQPGNVYLAPGEHNLVLRAGAGGGRRIRFGFTDEKWTEFNHPSIDCLFTSAAEVYGKAVMGVILTGMGRDGGAGLAAIRRAGGYTLGQDQSSSIVYGMARHAQLLGGVVKECSAHEIPRYVLKNL